MTLGEKLLLTLSRDPRDPDRSDAVKGWTLESSLDRLRRVYPGLDSLVRGRRVLDFGCGSGWQALGLRRAGAIEVLGVESNPQTLVTARALADRHRATDVAFAPALPDALAGAFDLVISQDSMEHFADPAAVLAEMVRALRPGGRLLITFGPPWYAPSGSHMHFFTSVPWVHLLFSERTVMRVRARYRSDGARRYEEVESGLNRMSLAKFERIVEASGMAVLSREYRCVRGWNWLRRLPGVRELFVNDVTCLLERPASAGGEPGRARVTARYARRRISWA